MALIQCHECNREVSDSAAACPGCGAPISHSAEEKNSESKGIGCGGIIALLFVGFVLLLVFASLASDKNPRPSEQSQVSSNGSYTSRNPYFGGELKSDVQQALECLRHDDKNAYAEMFISGKVEIIPAGTSFFVVEHGFSMVRIRIKGESRTLWTVVEITN